MATKILCTLIVPKSVRCLEGGTYLCMRRIISALYMSTVYFKVVNGELVLSMPCNKIGGATKKICPLLISYLSLATNLLPKLLLTLPNPYLPLLTPLK